MSVKITLEVINDVVKMFPKFFQYCEKQIDETENGLTQVIYKRDYIYAPNNNIKILMSVKFYKINVSARFGHCTANEYAAEFTLTNENNVSFSLNTIKTQKALYKLMRRIYPMMYLDYDYYLKDEYYEHLDKVNSFTHWENQITSLVPKLSTWEEIMNIKRYNYQKRINVDFSPELDYNTIIPRSNNYVPFLVTFSHNGENILALDAQHRTPGIKITIVKVYNDKIELHQYNVVKHAKKMSAKVATI